MRRLVAAFGLAVLTSLPVGLPAAAAPADIQAALTGRPATLMDLSLARLEALVQADGIVAGYSGWATLQDDKITLMAWLLTRPATDDACKSVLDRIKRLGGVDPETGFPDQPASAFASFFSYPQLDEFSIDPSYMETVDSMFDITVVIGVAGDGKAVICKSPLLSKDVTYSRE